MKRKQRAGMALALIVSMLAMGCSGKTAGTEAETTAAPAGTETLAESASGTQAAETAAEATTENAAGQESGSGAGSLHFTAGAYSGEGQGFGGPLTVEVEVDETSIVSITVTENQETEGIGSNAVEKLPGRIVEAQSLAVDVISGCTFSSNAILEAVKNALVEAGGDMEALTAKPAQTETPGKGEQKELTADLVIVGAGGAGMTAALKANEQGLTVLVLEKQAYVGGATAMSSSSALAQGTRAQKEQQITDSAELCFMDLLQVGEFRNDPIPAWLLASYSGEAIDWLNDDMGVLFDDDLSDPSVEYSAGRERMSVTYSGAGLCQDLLNVLEKKGITLMTETRAYQLTDQDGRVNGVLARGEDGTEYTVKAEAVLLATGGYCFDDTYIGEEYASLPCSGSKANTGDGIDMALAYGAVLQNMEMVAVAGHGIRKGDSAQHTKPGCLVAYATTGTILVNQAGERFVNETGADAPIVDKMRTEGRVFMLMDQAAFTAYTQGSMDFHYFTQEELDQWLQENGQGTTVFAHGETLEEAAAQVGMDAAGLAATVERYNAYVAEGEDADFGRLLSLPIGEGPYYLVEQCLRYSTTLGGLTINEHMQLVNEADEPIPGLYAAGEVVGGVFGKHFPPSAGVGWALTSGMLAGQEIAQALKP